MSDELRAWLNELRSRGIGSETAALLIDKCEELADATEAGLRFFRVVAHCDECNQPTNPIFNSREGYCVVHVVKFVDLVKKQYAALRAPGGGEL